MHQPGFLGFLDQQKNGQRLINSLRHDNGNDLTEPSEICKRAVDIYSNLYASEYQIIGF